MANDLLLELVIKAVDLATKDLDEINAKVKELGQAVTQSGFSAAGSDMRAFGEAVKNATDPMAEATAKALAFNTALVGVASVLASQAYNSAKSYESALADLGKVIDGGMDAAQRYGAQLNQTAQQFAQNGEQLVQAMANFVQAGYSAEEAFQLVTESTKLMIAGDLEAAQSSELLVSILKGFKAEAGSAASVVDLLNEVSNQYATDVKQLATGMAALSPIAKQMGFSMQETAGLLTPIIEVYRSGSEAADALKTSLQQLTANTAPVKAALAGIGVSQTDLNGTLRDGKDVFLDVARAFTGLSEAQKAYYAQELVGIEQAGRFSTVLNNLGDYLKVTDVAMQSAGSSAKEVAVRLETAEAAGKRADESFRQLSVTIGNAFKPQIQGVVTATGELTAAFDRSIKAGDLAPLLNVLKPQIAAVENLVRAMAANLEKALAGVDWRPLAEGLKTVSGELGEAFAKLTEGMDLTTVEGLRTLLQAIINLLGDFAQFVGGAVDGLQPLLGALNTLFQAVSQGNPTLSRLAGEIAGLATSANQIIPVITKLGSIFFGTIGTLAEVALKIGLVVAALRLLSAAGIPVIGVLGNLARAFFALNPAVVGAMTALAGFPGLVTALVAGAGAIGAGIGTLIDRFVRWASGGQSVGTMLADLVDKLTGLEDRLNRSATAEELAAARAERLARAKAQQAEATRKAAEEEEKQRIASENMAREQERKLALNASETESINRLKAFYAAMGLVYDETTGRILRQGEATEQQNQQSRELGIALDKLGVASNYMAERITADGQEVISTFRSITQNAQATASQIEAAFRKAIDSAQTEAEVKQILAAYKEWVDGAKQGTGDVAAATEVATKKTRELHQAVTELSPAVKALTAAGADEIEIKKTQAIETGNFTEYLRLEAEQRKQATQGFVEQTLAAEENAQALERESAITAGVGLLQKQLAEYLDSTRKRMDELSASARLYFDAVLEANLAANNIAGAMQNSLRTTQAWTNASREGSDAIAEFAGEIANASAQMGAAKQDLLFAADDMRVWISSISLAEGIVKKAFYEQATAAETLRLRIHDLAESGRLSMATLVSAEREAQDGFKLLDDEDLANLRSEIEAAKQKLKEMQQATEDARARLAELNAELLEAQGQDQKAKLLRQQLDYETRLAEIEKQRREAELLGNRELVAILTRQEEVLRQINAAKLDNIKAEQETAKTGDQTTNSWKDAEGAIRSTSAALAEVHDLGRRVAGMDLSGLHSQMTGLAAQADKLRSVL